MKCYLSFCDAVVFCNSARVESRRWRKMAKQRCSVVRERRFHLTRLPAAAAAAAASAANGQILIVTSFNAIMSDQSSLSLNSPRPPTFYASLSASPYASPYMPPSLCRPISAALSLPLSLSVTLYISFSASHSVPILPLSVCRPIYIPLSICLSLSPTISCSLHPSLPPCCLSLFLPPYLTPLSVSLCLPLYFPLSLLLCRPFCLLSSVLSNPLSIYLPLSV